MYKAKRSSLAFFSDSDYSATRLIVNLDWAGSVSGMMAVLVKIVDKVFDFLSQRLKQNKLLYQIAVWTYN